MLRDREDSNGFEEEQRSEKIDELTAKEEEMQQLQQQLDKFRKLPY